MERVVRVVFEKGVLKPLTPLRLKERSHFLATLYPEAQWREEFERLRRRMRIRTRGIPQSEIEAEITRARALSRRIRATSSGRSCPAG
jgi:predicted DNA-binding antitoxin AbrB/MazE fold protein